MIEEYYAPAGEAQSEYSVKKSKFICYVKPAETAEAAQLFLESIRRKHWDANHNVWAWRIGTGLPVERCSDDGEPTGTAGLPILEVLRKKELTNCVVVVTRYFGGVLLGAGGLVRAYTESTVLGLDQAGTVRYCRHQLLCVTVSYPMLGGIQKLLEDAGAKLEKPDFGADVVVKAWVLPSERPALEKKISELGRGGLDVKWGEDKHLLAQ